ncbi:MAG: molybdenum cofactor guanylyltransferase [Gallionella sp.]|nr:molybdenum cofactor guanylyltransferase [Gallionella sp.]
MIDDCTALILAGGESRRMGQDKARLRLGDKTLLQSVIAALEPLFSEIIVSVREPRAECELSQVCDDPLHAGPLAGLAAGIERARTAWVFVVACDMPFITGELIGHLADFRAGVEAVVPVVAGYPQPLAAFYATRTLKPLREILYGGGKQSFRALLEKLDVRYVSEDEMRAADLRGFFDLDTPEDMAIAANRSGELKARRIE